MQDLYETIHQVLIGEAKGSAKAHFKKFKQKMGKTLPPICLLYTSPSPRD